MELYGLKQCTKLPKMHQEKHCMLFITTRTTHKHFLIIRKQDKAILIPCGLKALLGLNLLPLFVASAS